MQNNKTPNKTTVHFFSKGVTLIELLLVVAIISTLGILSTTVFSRFLTQNAVSNTTDQFVNTLRKAQIYSMSGKRNSNWGVNYSNNTITLFKGDAYGQDTSFNETFTVNSVVAISGISGDIVFSRVTGLPNSTPTITVSSTTSNSSKTFTINSQGVVNRN